MSQGRLQVRKKKHLNKLMRKNVSMTLSKFKDTKKIEDFRLKILWKLIMNLRMKINLVTVRPKKWISETNPELN